MSASERGRQKFRQKFLKIEISASNKSGKIGLYKVRAQKSATFDPPNPRPQNLALEHIIKACKISFVGLSNTVLGQIFYTHRMLHKSVSSSPITLVFTLEPRYICTILWKKVLGRTPQNNPHFLDFSKKSATQKTRFFPIGRNFGHHAIFEKSPKFVDFWGPRPQKFFSTKFG